MNWDDRHLCGKCFRGLKETLEKEEKVTLGLTTYNIAQLLLVYPHLKEKIEEIVVMVGLRNGTPRRLEFNFYVDPSKLFLTPNHYHVV